MKRLNHICALLFFLVSIPIGLNAQDTLYWTGSVNDQWSTVGNWSYSTGGSSAGVVPGSSSRVIFDGNSGDNCIADVAFEVQSAQVDTSFDDTIRWNDDLNLGVDAKITGGLRAFGGVLIVNSSELWVREEFIIGTGIDLHINAPKFTLENVRSVEGDISCQALRLMNSWTSCEATTVSGNLAVSGQLRIAGAGCVKLEGDGQIEANANVVLVNNSYEGGGDLIVKITGSAVDQLFWGKKLPGQSVMPNIVVDKSGGNLILMGDISVEGSWQVVNGSGVGDPGNVIHFYGTEALIESGGGTDFTNLLVFEDIELHGTGTLVIEENTLVIDGQLRLGDAFLDVSAGGLYMLSTATNSITNSNGGLLKLNQNFDQGIVLQNVNTSTGVWVIPFKDESGNDLAVEFTVNTAGVPNPEFNNSAFVAVSTYGTFSDLPERGNQPAPFGIYEFTDVHGDEAHTRMLDRFWLFDFGDDNNYGFVKNPELTFELKFLNSEGEANNELSEIDISLQSLSTFDTIEIDVDTSVNSIESLDDINSMHLLTAIDREYLLQNYLKINDLEPELTVSATDPNASFSSLPLLAAYLDGRNLSENVRVRLLDASYADALEMDESVQLSANKKDFYLSFEPGEGQSQVEIATDNNPLKLSSQRNLRFRNLKISSASDGIEVQNSENLVFENVQVINSLASPTGTGMSISNSDEIQMIDGGVNNFNIGLDLTNVSGLVIRDVEVMYNQTGLNASLLNGASISSSIFRRLPCESAVIGNIGVNVIGVVGDVTIVGNVFNYLDKAVVLHDINGTAEFSGNSLQNVENIAFDGVFESGTLKLSSNYGDNASNDFLIEGRATESDYYSEHGVSGLMSLEILDNRMIGQTGKLFNVQVKNIDDILISIHRNTFQNSARNIQLNNLGLSSGEQSVSIMGNAMSADEHNVQVLNIDYSLDLYSNSMTSDGLNDKSSIVLDGTETIQLCGNIMENTGDDFLLESSSGTLSGLTSNWNDLWIPEGNNSNATITLGANDIAVNPSFQGSGFLFPGKSVLDLQDQSIDCMDLSQFENYLSSDVNNVDRVWAAFDLGGVELSEPPAAVDPVYVELDNGYSFYPNASGDYSHFKVHGLDAYSTVETVVRNGEGQVVFQSSNDVISWDGTMEGSTETVQEGVYTFEVNYDQELLSGYMYIIPQ